MIGEAALASPLLELARKTYMLKRDMTSKDMPTEAKKRTNEGIGMPLTGKRAVSDFQVNLMD